MTNSYILTGTNSANDYFNTYTDSNTATSYPPWDLWKLGNTSTGFGVPVIVSDHLPSAADLRPGNNQAWLDKRVDEMRVRL